MRELLLTASFVVAMISSFALDNVLRDIRFLSDHRFTTLTQWAGSGAPAPSNTTFDPERTEAAILALERDDRHAVLSWLRGNGRGALYARGENDSRIGSRDPANARPTPTATPNPWRSLPLATASLDNPAQGSIKVLGGFAAAKRDGTSVIACVSFENQSPKTATEVVFEFPLLSEAGAEVGKLTLDRRGTFSPNIGIHTFDSMSDWQGGSIGPASRNDNCVRRDIDTAALPILEARIAGYRVVKVLYDDGTTWTPSS